MNSDERLEALKKAYADILLNTSKEAAARIMESERKSVKLQHELNASKEQAVQMLLRLKRMMDSKIREAETNSLSQKKKIDELEAQLQEAEDVVKELREELRDVRDELKRVKKSQPKEKKTEITSSATVYMERSALDQINEVYNTYQDDIDGIGSDNVIEPDTAFIQEENILNVGRDNIVEPDAAPIQEESRVNAIKLQGEVNKGNPENSFYHMGSSYISKPNLPSIILRNKVTEPNRNRRTQRIRAFEEKLMAGELTFSDTADEAKNDANGNEDGDDEEVGKKSGRGANRKVGAVPAVQKVKTLKRKRNTRNKKITMPSSGHLSDQALVGDRRSDISSGELNSDNNNVEQDENPLNLLCRLSEEMKNERTLLKCTKVSESVVLSEAVGLQGACAYVDKVDVPEESSKEAAAATICDLSRQSTTFKYTFQRRKKQCLSNVGSSASVENKIMMEKEVEKQNDPLEMEKSTSVAESSRDSRRVAQVAHQLISLSEKKWWK